MSTLTFEQQTARDLFVTDIVSTVAYRINNQEGELQPYDIEDWEATAKDMGLSEKAISQVVEEVRQTLKLLLKFSKKRVA